MTQLTAARPAGGQSKASKAPSKKAARGYLQRSELPLTSLVFLLPFLVLYEVGTRHLSTDIIAFTWMQDFFRFFGASGRHLPALGVVSILLAWHLARGDRWRVSPRHLGGMLLESLALAFPLILLGLAATRYVPLAAAATKPLPSMIVLSVGAGIYEELVFRLIAFAGLSFLFVNVMRLRPTPANLLMVVISSLGFSLYHYLGHEGFQLRSFAFRTMAGFYFGAVFAFRGFGISAGAHASYDIIVSLLRWIA